MAINDTVECSVRIDRRTENSVQCYDMESGKTVWLPESELTVIEAHGDNAVVEIPEWLAIEKGLV